MGALLTTGATLKRGLDPPWNARRRRLSATEVEKSSPHSMPRVVFH